MGAPHVWVVGSTMVDLITYATRPPAPGETMVGDRFALGTGGKGANQAVMAARLGASVTLVNAVGDDAFGQLTLSALRAEGIEVAHVVTVVGESTGVAPILVEPDGTNRIIVVPGANGRMDPDLATAVIAGASSVDVVVGQLEIPQAVTAAAFRAARARGATTILNPAPFAPLAPDLLAVTDWLVPNEVEAAALAEELGIAAGAALDTDDAAVDAFQAVVGSGLCITLGSAGAVGRAPGGTVVRVPATAVVATDTTGAGDAFVGAFAVTLATGADLATALRVACALATDSVQRPGTQRSFAAPADARRIARENGGGQDVVQMPH